MCRHIYDWNIVNCDVKQPIQLNSTITLGIRKTHSRLNPPGPLGGAAQRTGDDTAQTAGEGESQTAGYGTAQTARDGTTQTAGNGVAKTAGHSQHKHQGIVQHKQQRMVQQKQQETVQHKQPSTPCANKCLVWTSCQSLHPQGNQPVNSFI